MTETPTPPPSELASALVAAQRVMPPVEKDGTNPHFKSRFVTLDALVAATRPVLNEHGLAINQFPAVGEMGQPVLVTRITHWSGDSLEYVMPLLLDESRRDMQSLGAAITYARRFAWAAALGVSSETDDDGEQTRPEPKAAAGGKPDPKPPGALITDAQRRRMIAIASENNMSLDQLRALLLEMTGAESTAIPRARYDEVIAAIQAEQVPF